jgi:hypothetical protein
MFVFMLIRYEHTTRTNRRIARRLGSTLPYLSRGHLLTPGERRFFFQGLKPAVDGRYLISFKVRLADVITAKDWESKHGRRISQKHLDFVLTCPRTTRIVAVVELNDASHSAADRQQRDAFVADALRVARVPLITFRIYQQYDEWKIRRNILAEINSFQQ